MTSGGSSFNDFPESQLTKFPLVHFSGPVTSSTAQIDFYSCTFSCYNCTVRHHSLRFCIHLLHSSNTICPRPKNGTFGVPGRPRPGCRTMKPKYGMSREIRDSWKP